jgi:hypothetical protein
MPGIHSPITKPLFILDGLVKTSGGSKNLAKGQFTIVSNEPTQNGAKIISDFAGVSKDTPLKIRVGRFDNSRLRSNTAPYYESSYFTSKDVVSLKANFPKFQKQTFDELLVGYDGINADTAITLLEGQTTVFDVILAGDPIAVNTGKQDYVVKMHFGREVGETNQEAVKRLVENLKDFTLPFGEKLTSLVDIKLVDSSNSSLAGTSYTFSTLSVTDDGTSNALALVQAQYAYNVVRTARSGFVSEYTLLHPTSVSLADFSKVVYSPYIKDCAACLSGYTDVVGGVVYNVSLEDDGTDQTTLVDNLPGYVAGTVAKIGTKEGFGIYSIVVDNALTDAEIASFVATNAITSTSEIKFIGNIAEVCNKSTTTTATWVSGTVCYASTEQYSIQLKDNDCGNTRLTELQAAYPGLVIEEGTPTGSASQTVTVSTDGVALAIIVDGVTYTTADAGTTSQTAAAFVAAHAASILAATGTVVTNPSANIISFVDAVEGFPTITSAAQTVSAVDILTTASTGGCQRVYSTTVVTNIVCDECSDIFLDGFKSVAPEGFDFSEWTLKEGVANANALMGIKLKGKKFLFMPTEVTRDEVPFYETSTRISVFGGYIEEQNENFQPIYSDIFNIVRLSRAQDRDALGYNYLPWEEVSRSHFLGETRHKDNLFANGILGEESVIKFDKQYVTYELTIDDTKYSQAIGGRSGIGFTHLIFVELGYHTAIESWLNKLAAKAGVSVVNPTA